MLKITQPLASIFCLLETIRFAVHYEPPANRFYGKKQG